MPKLPGPITVDVATGPDEEEEVPGTEEEIPGMEEEVPVMEEEVPGTAGTLLECS